MPKKKMSDIVFHRISPPDHKKDLTPYDLSRVFVKRLGLKRKESRADHAKLLLELIKYRRDNIPIGIEKISQILSVSQSQSYEEIRKWRSLGLIEFVKIPGGNSFVKGYMMPANTTNRLLDRVESSFKSFMRKTRRIAKDFDDLLMLEMARGQREASQSSEVEEKEIEQVEEDMADSLENEIEEKDNNNITKDN